MVRLVRLNETSFSRKLDRAIAKVHPGVQYRVMQLLPKFYLPYSGVDSADSVLVHGDRAMRFPSRKAALAFVMEHYRDERTAVNANKAIISIEGQDGLWRSFDTRLLPAREHG